jgi:hypothetical protein
LVHLGLCTLWWPYMDITMVVFPIYLKYEKTNKMKIIEIIKKGFIYLKLS